MNKVLSPEMVVELKRRHFRKKMQEVYWLAAIALIIFAVAAIVVPYLQKMSREEDALEAITHDIARVYHEDGINGVRALCGTRVITEVGRNYHCRIGREKITIEQFSLSVTGPVVLRKKHIPRVGRLEATQKEASVL